MTFKNLLIPRMVLSCVDVKQFGTLVGDKSQNLGDKSQQPSYFSCYIHSIFACVVTPELRPTQLFLIRKTVTQDIDARHYAVVSIGTN